MIRNFAHASMIECESQSSFFIGKAALRPFAGWVGKAALRPFAASTDDPGKGPGYGDDQGDDMPVLTVKARPKVTRPPLYKVLLLNDDFTPMDFVVQILQDFFNKTHEEATHIMLEVHLKGQGLCGVYSYEVAETKLIQVLEASRAAQHPLQCKMEKA